MTSELIALAKSFASFVESVLPARLSKIASEERSLSVAKFVLSAKSPLFNLIPEPAASRGPRGANAGSYPNNETTAFDDWGATFSFTG